MLGLAIIVGHLVGDYLLQNDWQATHKGNRTFPCAIHCCLYGLAMWGCMSLVAVVPVWFLVAVAVSHFPLDRWGLARLWMTRVSGQAVFAGKPFAPWSIVVVDNTFHLLIAFVLAVIAMG